MCVIATLHSIYIFVANKPMNSSYMPQVTPIRDYIAIPLSKCRRRWNGYGYLYVNRYTCPSTLVIFPSFKFTNTHHLFKRGEVHRRTGLNPPSDLWHIISCFRQRTKTAIIISDFLAYRLACSVYKCTVQTVISSLFSLSLLSHSTPQRP